MKGSTLAHTVNTDNHNHTHAHIQYMQPYSANRCSVPYPPPNWGYRVSHTSSEGGYQGCQLPHQKGAKKKSKLIMTRIIRGNP